MSLAKNLRAISKSVGLLDMDRTQINEAADYIEKAEKREQELYATAVAALKRVAAEAWTELDLFRESPAASEAPEHSEECGSTQFNNHAYCASVDCICDCHKPKGFIVKNCGGCGEPVLGVDHICTKPEAPKEDDFAYKGVCMHHREPVIEVGDVTYHAKLDIPTGLHVRTQALVINFASALALKLYAAQRKYGYSDGWMQGDWLDECRARLQEHLEKGDPRDVAAYCAFLWFHGESTNEVPKDAPCQAVFDGEVCGQAEHGRHHPWSLGCTQKTPHNQRNCHPYEPQAKGVRSERNAAYYRGRDAGRMSERNKRERLIEGLIERNRYWKDRAQSAEAKAKNLIAAGAELYERLKHSIKGE